MDETATMIEDTFHRLQDRPGVSAVVVMNREGQQIKSSMSSGQLADRYSMIIAKLVNAIGASLNALEEKPIDQSINFIRIRTMAKEFLIVPDGHFIFAVVQTPGDDQVSDTSANTSTRKSFDGTKPTET